MVVFDAGVFTDCGSYRPKNEDSFQLCGYTLSEDKRRSRYGGSMAKRKFGVAAVFDGMGGEKFGDIASGISAELLAEHMGDILTFGRDGLDDFVTAANKAVCRKSSELNAPMGSTMALIAVSDEIAAVYNIGDSRAYLVRAGQIRQITKDHTVAARLSSIGITNSGKSQKHQLTQYLGIPPDEVVIQAFSFGEIPLRDKDKILLCSDGVTEGVGDEQLLDILTREKSAVELAKDAVDTALENGSTDNITAVVFTFSDDGKPNRNPGVKAQKKREPEKAARNDAAVPADAPAYDYTPQIPPKHEMPVERRPMRESGGVSGNVAASPIPAAKSGGQLTGYWACNIGLALALGFVIGIIYGMVK